MTTMRSIGRTSVLALAGLALCLSLNACASMGKKTADASPKPKPDNSAYATPPEPTGIPLSHLFGGGGTTAPKQQAYNTQAGIGVNAYLWRASLDTMSFMQLASADPWGGVIITDWYTSPEKPDERFKATVYILDSRLRADALNVSVFKQVQQNGQWVDADVAQETQIQVENAILDRARELRHSDIK
ncbi:MAG TPA: DUF3576 domain-containing protein [Asticcacaulis sp.]|nr:DUF3576 domain-containing protein [Asticcacaulis sp.]